MASLFLIALSYRLNVDVAVSYLLSRSEGNTLRMAE